MLKLAFTISCYRLLDFVQLGLAQLRKLSPESPVLVSDDRANESPGIESLASRYSAAYICSKIRRGHFAADMNSLVNALVFAKARECDVAVKVSQRFIFRKPESIEWIKRCFENPEICAATPGQPTQVNGASRASKGFAAFTTLSDVVAIRVGSISPEELIAMYREKFVTDRAPWGSFIEVAVDQLHSKKFPGRTLKIDQLTNPNPPEDPIYLRRYQTSPELYHKLAAEHGIGGKFTVEEWGAIEGRKYLCKPRVV